MKEKLLILDDESLILRSLENLFEDDYEVFTTSDPEAALGLALKHDIAVVLCDERMPGVSGHEFLGRVRGVSRATRVMMSGYADMNALTKAVNSGQIFAYIAKPWEPLQLMSQVGAAVSHFKLGQEVDQERGLLRALMENIPDLIYFKDCQSRFTRVNQAHARNLGAKDAAECIGKSNADYFKPEDALRWRQQEEEIVSSGQPRIDQVDQLANPRGGPGWWSTTKVPMFDRSGQVSGIAGISRDITALKNNEESLREQSERYRMILETANDAFIGMDPDGSITAWNPRAELIFGWAAAEVLGRRLCDTVIAPAHRTAPGRGVEHFLTSLRGSMLNQAVELVAMHRDGHQFPVEATVWPVRVGGACSFNAFVRDISERRRAEEARKREASLVQLLQRVTVAANRSSSIEHTAKTCVDLICSYTGWPVGHVYLRASGSAEEPFSAGIWYLEEAGRFAAFRETSDRRPLATGEGLPGRVLVSGKPEWLVDLADKEAFPRAAEALSAGLRSGFAFPVVANDNIVGVLEFFSLQTVQPDEKLMTIMGQIGSQLGQVIIRQRVEKDLQSAKASAESANKAKSEFLTTMSHEMRTPMNAILGMADLLSETSLRDEQREYVHIFQKAGASLLDLINNILDLSKVESGHVELESTGFDLRLLLEKIVEMMLSRAQIRGLRLSLEVLPGVPLALVGDPNRLRQILINLVGNALKFTEQGSVTLRVERDPAGTAGCLRFSVVDTGIGIAADKTEMIFGRFTQADSSTTRKYGGTGLGLAISKGLVELMGGRIGCSSETGKGSTFVVTVPFGIRQEMETTEPLEPAAIVLPPSESPSQKAATRILIAEDSELNLALVKAYLRGSGFELDFAENGQIAVDKVISGRPHLVLMDLQMPVMGGLEATRIIRQWEAATQVRPIPILALTAHAAGDGAGRSLEAGCTEHLTKPIKRATLLEAIARNLSGKIRITPSEGVEDLVPAYLASVRRGMNEILAGADSKGCEVALRVGHQFKGEGESYGFPEITRTGAAVELAAIADDGDEIRNQILALSTYLDRVEIVV
jgi:PAS domain S-box-containing protein